MSSTGKSSDFKGCGQVERTLKGKEDELFRGVRRSPRGHKTKLQKGFKVPRVTRVRRQICNIDDGSLNRFGAEEEVGEMSENRDRATADRVVNVREGGLDYNGVANGWDCGIDYDSLLLEALCQFTSDEDEDNNDDVEEDMFDNNDIDIDGDANYVVEEEENSDGLSNVGNEDETDYGIDDDNDRKSYNKVSLDPIKDFGGRTFNIKPGEDIQFEVGHIFSGVAEFKDILKDYIVKGGYPIKLVKNDLQRITAICDDGKCSWRVHASLLPGQSTFMVKTLRGDHTCLRVQANKIASAKWISQKLQDLLKANDSLDNDTLRACLKDWGVDPKNWKLNQAKVYARRANQGTFSDSYGKLQKYCDRLLELNPGSVVKIEALPRNNLNAPKRFWRIFICLHAVKVGFLTGCRPFIGIDGCHLKGPFGGALLAATSIDGNLGIFPLAYAVVDIENNANWRWFLNLLSECLYGDSRCKSLTIMTDGQKGLGDMVEQVFGGAHHRRCARHILNNFKQVFPGLILQKLFWEAARATTRTTFNFALAKMRQEPVSKKEISGVMMGPVEWLCLTPSSKWARFAFDHGAKSDHLTNNMAESFNSWLSKIRGKPIVELLDRLRQKIMVRLQKRYDRACSSEYKVTPKVFTILKSITSQCRKLKVLPGRNMEFEVLDGVHKFGVYINSRECSCNLWSLSGIPCVHAAACISFLRHDIEDYVHEYYSKEMYIKANLNIVHPFPNDDDLEPINGAEKIYPPILKRMAGRPRKNRRRQPGEEPPTARSKTVTCATCGEMGHNKRSCQRAPVKSKLKQDQQRKKVATKRRKVQSKDVMEHGLADVGGHFDVGESSQTH